MQLSVDLVVDRNLTLSLSAVVDKMLSSDTQAPSLKDKPMGVDAVLESPINDLEKGSNVSQAVKEAEDKLEPAVGIVAEEAIDPYLVCPI